MREVRPALFFMLGLIPFLLSTFRLIVADDLSSFWDAKQYLNGFHAIQSSENIFGGMSYFGKITEITLSLFYFVISFFLTIETTLGILLINNTIFWVIYTPAVFVFSKHLFAGLALQRRSKLVGELVWLNVLFITPLGIAFQVGRQAICFALIIFVVTLVSQKKIFRLHSLVFFVTILTHVYSLLTSYIITSLIRSRASVGLCLLFVGIFTTYFGLDIFNTNIPILYVQTFIPPFSNSYLNFSLLVLLILFIPTQSIDVSAKSVLVSLLLIAIITLYAFQPLFILRRVLFGFDHVILFLTALVILKNRYSSYPSKFVSKLYFLLPLTFSLKILEGYIFL